MYIYMSEEKFSLPVQEQQHWPIHNVDLASSVAGRQGSVSSDHDQLVAGLLQHAQGWLRLLLQGAAQHSKAAKGEPLLDVGPCQAAQVCSGDAAVQLLVCQGNDSAA